MQISYEQAIINEIRLKPLIAKWDCPFCGAEAGQPHNVTLGIGGNWGMFCLMLNTNYSY